MSGPGARASLVLAAVLPLAAGCAPAGRGADAEPSTERISVIFVEPERFTDLTDPAGRRARAGAAILEELARFVRDAGARAVADGRALEVRVTDIDMAGELEPWRGPRLDHVRFMRDVYAPRIDLEFTLKDAHGGVVGEGKRSLRDPNYLIRAKPQGDDPLRYEKTLLGDWLQREFAP